MTPRPLHKLIAAPEGITLDGMPLDKFTRSQIAIHSLRYIERAEALLKTVRPEEWNNRTPHYTNNVSTLAKASMMLALANPVIMDKYSADQPRDWHGRWTNGGNESAPDVSSSHDHKGEHRLADSDQIMTDASNGNTENKTVNYPNGQSVIDPNTKEPYPMPPGMDIAANIKNAKAWADSGATQTKKDLLMISWFMQGGPQDYQRPDGYIAATRGDFEKSYTHITNYNYGIIAATMGYTLEETLHAAGLHNRMLGNTNYDNSKMDNRYGILKISVKNVSQGYNDYKNGTWTN